MPSTTSRASDAAARLLLIDRDPAGGRVMAANLGGSFLATPQVSEVRSGRQAAEMLKGESFDIVLVDLSSLDDLSAQTEDAVAGYGLFVQRSQLRQFSARLSRLHSPSP